MSNILIRGLYKSFEQYAALSNVDLDIKHGSSVAILGESGSGKSVLLKSIAGLITPDKGKILIDDVDVTHLRGKSRFDLMSKCGVLFQGNALFDSLNILDNVTFFLDKVYGLSRKKRLKIAITKLEDVGLEERVLELYPSDLSGGMQKRVGLARAICHDPKILFFDEPTTGLDPIMSEAIGQLINKITLSLKATAIIITHDIKLAHKIADQMYIIRDGSVAWHGTKEDVKSSIDPYILQFFQNLNIFNL